MMSQNIFLSIILPIRNEEKFILETLKSLIYQDYPQDRFEIIVIDGQSTDKTIEYLNTFLEKDEIHNIRIFQNPGVLSSRGRNIGIKMAKGQLLAVIDGHVYIPNNQLFKKMEYFKTEFSALCLARPAPLDIPFLKTDNVAYWIACARKSWLGHSRNSYIYSDHEGYIDPMSSGFAYDRQVFDKIGFFDESFDAAEDVEFHYRLKEAGIRAYTSPDLLIYSYPRDSLKSLFKQQIRYGEGRARFIKKHPGGFTKETIIPAWIFITFIIWPVLFLFSLKLALMLTSFIILYSSIVFLTGIIQPIKNKKGRATVVIAAAIWTTHMGLGWGFIKKYFSR
jgi:succinoglycan biosynthesis protein ExoA